MGRSSSFIILTSGISSLILWHALLAVLSLRGRHVLAARPALLLERLLLALRRRRLVVAAVVAALVVLRLPARGGGHGTVHGGERLLLVAVLKLDGIAGRSVPLDLAGQCGSLGFLGPGIELYVRK